MSQIKKLDSLINKVIEEELTAYNKLKEQSQEEFITSDGTSRTLTPQQKDRLKKAKPGTSVSYRKAGTTPSATMEEGEIEQDNTEESPSPSAADIAGKMSEILDKLNTMSEMKDDPKYEKHAAKAAKYMEAAKSALEGLTNYEAVLEEKDKKNQEKEANGVLNAIRKALKKLIKDENTVNKIMNKMPVNKALELLKATDKQVDEQKVAKAMLNVALKEGYVNKASVILELYEETDKGGSDEDKYLSDKEKLLSDSRKASLIKFRKLEDKYLKDSSISNDDKTKYKAMSFNDKQKIIQGYKKTAAAKPEEEKEVDVDKAVSAITGASAGSSNTDQAVAKLSKAVPSYTQKVQKTINLLTDDIKLKLEIDPRQAKRLRKEKQEIAKYTIKDALDEKELNAIGKALLFASTGKKADQKLIKLAETSLTNLKNFIYANYFSYPDVPEGQWNSFINSIDSIQTKALGTGDSGYLTPKEKQRILGPVTPKDEDTYLSDIEKRKPKEEKQALVIARKKEELGKTLSSRSTGLEKMSEEEKKLFVKYMKAVGEKMARQSYTAYSTLTKEIKPLLVTAKLSLQKRDKVLFDKVKNSLESILKDLRDNGYDINYYLKKYKNEVEDAAKEPTPQATDTEDISKSKLFAWKMKDFNREVAKFEKDIEEYRKKVTADPSLVGTLKKPKAPVMPEKPVKSTEEPSSSKYGSERSSSDIPDSKELIDKYKPVYDKYKDAVKKLERLYTFLSKKTDRNEKEAPPTKSNKKQIKEAFNTFIDYLLIIK